ncbi:MAG: DMT family transporter [Desulfobulbaceae bacterium]|uniref:DMT family transporter n=1 Tax=Candidatus Desulfatifera sulfidica TaxID=2841691 RepID=A0A8J6TDE3_9BACT|nr:DMT family transporter [Candidatus Desulfatifera sulfidica]
MSRQPVFFVHLLMICCAGLVAGSFTVGEAIATGLDPAILTLVRFVLATFLFAPFIYWRYGLDVKISALLRYSLVSGVLVAFFWTMFLALRTTTALNTSVIFTLVPAISALYARILVGERLHGRLPALLLAAVGALWVIFRGDVGQFLTLDWNQGDLIFFGGCLVMALYTPLVRLLHRGEPMAVMTFWIMVTGCVWLLFVTGNELSGVNWGRVSFKVWSGIFYLAVFSTIISFFLSQYAILSLGPTRVMAYSYLYPLLVLVINRLLGHPWPDPVIYPGVVLLLAAMFVFQRR